MNHVKLSVYPKSFGKLDQRKTSGSFRELSSTQYKIDFCSNDYLGISKKLSHLQFSQEGSTGSRLISGNSNQAKELEEFLSTFFKTEASLVFNSGYDANLGLFSSIAQRGDTILYDEFIHASVRDGIRLSQCSSFSFKHNDLVDLGKKVKFAHSKKPEGDIFVSVESLYSMDGDFSPLEDMVHFCKSNNLFLIVDEAHSAGVLGKNGKGLCYELAEDVFARLITFGKAYGAHGAAILGSQKLKEHLINFARSFIYTTALPPNQYELIKHALELSVPHNGREILQNNISLFRELNTKYIQISEEKSPIQILSFSKLNQIQRIVSKLFNEGFWVKAILPPTVSIGKECIRTCLHSFNSKEEIIKFSEILNQI